jgi:periplasmic divalent cation tolerance protein
MSETAVVYATFPNRDEALATASRLLDEGSIACANVIGGVTSVYRWEGTVHQDAEVVLIAKTTQSKVAEAIAAIEVHHSYDCPCVTS